MGLLGKHVVVAGGGVGGAATALLAARAGARVTLLEQYAQPHAPATGILLQPNGLAVLYGLGLEERLRSQGARMSSFRVADGRGRTIIEMAVPDCGGGLDHALMVRRDGLASALHELIALDPAIERRFGAEVLQASPRGEVVYREQGARQVVVADLVVGADGVNSTIRRRSGLRARLGCGLRYIRGVGPELPLGGLTEYWTALGIFGVAPLDRGSYFYASTHAEPLARALRAGDMEGLRDAWRRELPLAGEILAGIEIDHLVSSYAVRVDCRRWTTGRVVLVGDAAHAMAPNLGQGASSALADAAVLVWELARPGAAMAALARYEARRRSEVGQAQDIAGLLTRLSDLTPAAVRMLRDGTIRLVGPWLCDELGTRMLEHTDPTWLRLAASDPTDRPVADRHAGPRTSGVRCLEATT